MNGTTEQGLLSRRLDRLRLSAPSRSVAPRTSSGEHAARLAATLGGRADGPLVIIETAHQLPLDRGALAGLPLPIDHSLALTCLDLETTGLATGPGTLAFLVGMGSWHGDTLVVRQLLLPDHADEQMLLEAIGQALPRDAALVTYNGRCFDWPLLVARFRLHGRPAPAVNGHHDLLPLSRLLWRAQLGNARLATIEAAVCDVMRDEDLPGALIPQRYFDYLRDRRPEPLRAVVEHNRQDIVSLARLLTSMAELASNRGGWPRAHPSVLAGLARAHARQRRWQEALEVVEAALGSPAWHRGVVGGGPLWRGLAADRARLLRRLGRLMEAAEAWLEIASRGGPGAAQAWLHVARYREHQLRDLDGALTACHEALAATERARMWGRTVPAVERDLADRMRRLRRRRARGNARAGRLVSRAA